MYGRSLGLVAVFLLLASCAQAPPKVADHTTPAGEAASRQGLMINFMAHEPPTHPPEQDISYNSHYWPRFPAEAAKAGHYGQVMLLIHVSAKGESDDIRVETSSGYPELDASAVDTAKHWIYMPAAKDGVHQPGWIRIPVSFGHPIPPPRSPDSLQVGIATEADAIAVMGSTRGTVRYRNGTTDVIWGNQSVGTVVLSFDATGTLTKIYKSKPAS